MKIGETECDLGALLAYVLFKYKGIPVIYASGWLYEEGTFIGDSGEFGHAVLFYDQGNGSFEKFDTTKYMQTEIGEYSGIHNPEKSEEEKEKEKEEKEEKEEKKSGKQGDVMVVHKDVEPEEVYEEEHIIFPSEYPSIHMSFRSIFVGR